MSFFGSLFKRDHTYFLQKGENHLAAERYADARAAFQEALETPCTAAEHKDEALIKMRLAETGNKLAVINIDEARHAISQQDNVKAEDHLQLALTLSADADIRQLAEELLTLLHGEGVEEIAVGQQAGCAGCGTGASEKTESAIPDEHLLSSEERYELMIQTLPADLPARYSGLGENFANAYLLAQDGQFQSAEAILTKIEDSNFEDILLYEKGVLCHRQGKVPQSEMLLRKAVEVNASNPLPYLALVQLLVEAGRISEAPPILNGMIQENILPSEARLYLADVYILLAQENEALSLLSSLLSSHLKREAAERLVTLLKKTGQHQEAAYVAKNFLKGCC